MYCLAISQLRTQHNIPSYHWDAGGGQILHCLWFAVKLKKLTSSSYTILNSEAGDAQQHFSNDRVNALVLLVAKYLN